jgi:hypothetical protein
MEGLSREWETEVRDGLVIYGDRTDLRIKAFHVNFDQKQWDDLVIGWAETHTDYRLNEELPPADPIFGWECQFCSFSHRCGQADSAQFADIEADGLLPLFSQYPREKVVAYLKAHDGAKLTPTLAHQYPELTEEYEVHQWHCVVCNRCYDYLDVEWDGKVTEPPLCPNCISSETPVPLHEPNPDQQMGIECEQ